MLASTCGLSVSLCSLVVCVYQRSKQHTPHHPHTCFLHNQMTCAKRSQTSTGSTACATGHLNQSATAWLRLVTKRQSPHQAIGHGANPLPLSPPGVRPGTVVYVASGLETLQSPEFTQWRNLSPFVVVTKEDLQPVQSPIHTHALCPTWRHMFTLSYPLLPTESSLEQHNWRLSTLWP